MMGSTAPKVSRISSVLVTRVRWLLEHHPLDASCWSPPILARVAYPFYSVLLFIFFLHLTIQISPSFFGGVGSKRVNALSPCYIRRLQSFSSAGFPALQPHPTPLRPEKCGGSGKLMKTCDLRSCASDLFSLVGPLFSQGLPCYSPVSSLGCTLG